MKKTDCKGNSKINDKAYYISQVEENTEKIERNYHGMFKVFDGYEKATENYYKENKQKILAIQKHLKIATA